MNKQYEQKPKSTGPFAEATFLTPRQMMKNRMLKHQGFKIAALFLIMIVLAASAAPLITPHDPYQQDLSIRLTPPIWHAKGTWDHPLGTDKLGRDYLSRLIYGARISLIIGVSAMLISAVIGTTMGVLAGYFGGRIDMIVTALVTIRLALPIMLVALAVVALVGGSLQNVILVLGFMIWNRFAVVIRASTQQLRSIDFIAAAKAAGCSTFRIIMTELLPSLTDNLIIIASIEISRAILIEAGLSFLGVGVQPPLPSWGLMVSEARDFMIFSPWMIVIPGMAILMLVLAINMLGDGIRDITAPEAR